MSCAPAPFCPALLLAVVLATLVTAPAGQCRTALVAGKYKSVFDAPIFETAQNGARQQTGTERITGWLQLDADGTMRKSITYTFNVAGKGYSQDTGFCEGVWQLQDGRLYFVITAVPRPNLKSDSTWLGAPRVTVTEAGITITDVAGAGLTGLHFSRTNTAIPGTFPPLANLAELKAMLARIVAPTPRPDYAGVASEQALKAVVHHAVATRDVTALVRVTYPSVDGLQPDPRFSTYMQYMNWLAFGVPQVKEMPAAELPNELARGRRAGGTFPPSASPRGMFLIGRTLGDGSSSFNGIYYGVVGDKWAILGNPNHLKRVATGRDREPAPAAARSSR